MRALEMQPFIYIVCGLCRYHNSNLEELSPFWTPCPSGEREVTLCVPGLFGPYLIRYNPQSKSFGKTSVFSCFLRPSRFPTLLPGWYACLLDLADMPRSRFRVGDMYLSSTYSVLPPGDDIVCILFFLWSLRSDYESHLHLLLTCPDDIRHTCVDAEQLEYQLQTHNGSI